LQRAPGRPDAWALQGALHKRAGRVDLAAQAYRRAIDVDPTYPDAWRNLARIDPSVRPPAAQSRA
jgi:Flp pilus assembly protein TadD